MKNTNDYFQKSMNEIIFENRNQNYGAFILRKEEDKNTKLGFLFAFLLISIFSIFILTKKAPSEIISDYVILDFYTPNIPDIILPKIEEQIIELPKEEKVNTKEFSELKVVVNNKAEDKKKTSNEELKNSLIGLKTDSSGVNSSIIPIKIIEPDLAGKGNLPLKNSNQVGYVLWTDEMPMFGASEDAIYKWLSKQIKYPKQALEINVEGKVYVEFIIGIDGAVTNAKIIRSVGFGCDEEALKAIQNMPKWKPGKQQGNPIPVKLTIPIDFKISKQ